MSSPEPEASPAQQEAVRRLLAEARHDGPVPPEVAARLDGVLAGLAAEARGAVDATPAASAPPAPVVDLEARRRRRRATGLLVAAAAVVVVGLGAGQLVDTSVDDSGGAESATAGGTEDDSAADRQDLGAAPEAAPAPTPGRADEAAGEAVPALTRRTFARDVRAIRATGAGTVVEDQSVVDADALTTSPMFVCAPAAWGPGRLVAVRYEGRPAVLALRPSVGETQAADLLQCGSGKTLRSITLPD